MTTTFVSGAAAPRVVESRSPQAPEDLVVAAPPVSRARVHAAAASAHRAQREWWSAGAAHRGQALKAAAAGLAANAQHAAHLLVREVGKPAVEARAEVNRAISILDYYAQQSFAPRGSVFPASTAGRLWSERRPHGVAGLITPWNFPVAIPLWKAAPALAAGNAVLLKPAPDALASALWLEELFADSVPAGLFQVLPGDAETGSAVVEASQVVSFTGSEAVGRKVTLAAASHGKPVQAEMGGQNAAIILPDADAFATARMVAGAAMGFAGQKCTATRRIVVVGTPERHSDVRDALVAAVAELTVGDPGDPTVVLGPVVNEASRDRVAAATSMVREDGGRVLIGGRPLDREGWFVTPGLVDGLPPDHVLAREELFGPFALVLYASDVPEAIEMAESVRYGLVTSVHGRDGGPLLEVVDRIGTGMIKVNAPTTGVDYYAPFGGERDSSYGAREQGPGALDFYSSSHTVTFAPHP